MREGPGGKFLSPEKTHVPIRSDVTTSYWFVMKRMMLTNPTAYKFPAAGKRDMRYPRKRVAAPSHEARSSAGAV